MTESETARHRVEGFLEFLAGVEDVGFVDFARRARLVACDLVEALDMVGAERSARRALQERCETQQELLGKRAYDALAKGTP